MVLLWKLLKMWSCATVTHVICSCIYLFINYSVNNVILIFSIFASMTKQNAFFFHTCILHNFSRRSIKIKMGSKNSL